MNVKPATLLKRNIEILELTPEIQNIGDKFVMDLYMVGNQQFVSCIDIYSKLNKDSAFVCVALHNWLNSEGVQIQVTTSKNGISDVS